jgi:hypothetical protein
MTTNYVKTIGTGGDYATVQAWWNDIPTVVGNANLVVADATMTGKALNDLSSSGIILDQSAGGPNATDSTHYVTLTSNAALNFSAGLNVASANGPVLTSTGTSDSAIVLVIGYTRLVGLQVVGARGAVHIKAGADNTLLDSCVFQSNGTGNLPPVYNESGNNVVIRNCVSYLGSGTSSNRAFTSGVAIELDYFTIAVASDASASFLSLVSLPTGTTATNCTFFGGGNTATFDNGGGTPTYTNCATDFASPPSGTAWQSGLTYANQFNGTTTATMDLKAKSGGALINNGTPIGGITTDIAGVTRTATPTIGAWQFSSGAAAVPSRALLGVGQSLLPIFYAEESLRRNRRMTRRRMLSGINWLK